MFCPKCGHENPNDAAFCMKCGGQVPGENVGRPATTSPPVREVAFGDSRVAPAAAVPPSLPPEQQVWTGAMSWQGMLTFGWLVAFAIPLPLIVYVFSVRAHFQPRGLWLLSLLSLVPLVVFCFRVWVLRTTTYRITNERINVLKGIFSRESNDLQLVRVADVQFQQTLLGRMLNVGNIRILSTDKTIPDLVISGVKSPADFKEMLWNLVRERRRNMIALEQLNQVPLQ